MQLWNGNYLYVCTICKEYRGKSLVEKGWRSGRVRVLAGKWQLEAVPIIEMVETCAPKSEPLEEKLSPTCEVVGPQRGSRRAKFEAGEISEFVKE